MNPLRSLTIDPDLLVDYAKKRQRPPNQKAFALITTKTHPTLSLAIHNYIGRTFVRQVWDDLLVAARTLVTETTTGAVVSRSFSKFFNYDEKLAYKPTGNEYAFMIEEKIDGSIISLFWYQNQWMMVSRSSFDSPHTTAARSILDQKYPRILDSLDKDKTYVFELVDLGMPIKVVYKKNDLVLLSIVSKDGQEPPHNFDWTTFPFPRPRVHVAPTVAPTALSKLNLENEEGFVVKFWLSPGDRYPQRIKVKFESYLQGVGSSVTQSTSKLSIKTATSPPSHAKILETYLEGRLKIHHFKAALISDKMEAHKKEYLRSLENVADDYGGEAWLGVIENTWNRIHALVSLQEADWTQTTTSLEREGYKQDRAKVVSTAAKQGFERRIKRADMDKSYRNALLAWFADLRSTDIILK
ncbi:RNA ligase-domain-containing protein [Flammula alnicola]|nr:RNA ligase-domain-containing protein [Flammula alnicola]